MQASKLILYIRMLFSYFSGVDCIFLTQINDMRRIQRASLLINCYTFYSLLYCHKGGRQRVHLERDRLCFGSSSEESLEGSLLVGASGARDAYVFRRCKQSLIKRLHQSKKDDNKDSYFQNNIRKLYKPNITNKKDIYYIILRLYTLRLRNHTEHTRRNVSSQGVDSAKQAGVVEYHEAE